ncbi:hypothetical protein OKA05_25210 [Luteolibacter arcticus]|uniref:Uncharacterized protein n=1 Tax=Luteolibacter arcticus TaxID=1581411 RepID=A0ABT3GQU7_9BACT|nr:hypothetical protein [Luteolibacter arcticus]MCW1925883.1 hypothetical protein [Luteolibacter arcticus]
MKVLLLSLILSASAAAFDEQAFGARLNGWTRDGSARYSLDGQRYRTTKPVVTQSQDGGETVRITVLHQANSWAEVPLDLEVAFAPDGRAQSFRITGKPRGKKVDTGLVSRPDAPAAVESQPAPSFEPVAEMKQQLFEAFESQVAQAAAEKDTRKRDLLARIYGPEPIDVAALSAGLRYNLDLLLRLPVVGK